jgi:hypothetical protein
MSAMKMVRILVVALVLMLWLVPVVAQASSTADIVVSVTAAIGNQCVTNFAISVLYVETPPVYHVQLSWTAAPGGNGTIIVANVGGWPSDCTDGVIYEGNGTSTTHVITNLDDLVSGIYYRVYSLVGDSCSSCYASGSVIASGNEAPSQGSTGNVTINTQGLDDMAGLMRVGFILAFPAIIGIIGAFRHSLGAYLVGIVGMGVSLSYVNDELGIYLAMPVVILIAALLFGAILDAWHERLVII